MHHPVRAKKHLGQHFLKEEQIALDITQALTVKGYKQALEIGPGTGVLSRFLLKRDDLKVTLMDVDQESIAYLHEQYPEHQDQILYGDFLKYDLRPFLTEPLAIIGNFPYNISSQILFRAFDLRDHIPEVVGMFQREVALRIASPPGSKSYGILSVLLQAFYDIEYLFTVEPESFIPPPKVKSGVIRLHRNQTKELDCNEKQFIQVVKMAFNQRRKTLRNAVKALLPQDKPHDHPLLPQRAEQLSVAQFVELTNWLFDNR